MREREAERERRFVNSRIHPGVIAVLGTVIVAALLFAVSSIVPAEAQPRSTRGPLTSYSQSIRGAQANAWSAAAVGIAGKSASLDSQTNPFCSAFGNSSAASTMTVEFSADSTTWYASAVNTGAVTGDFGVNFNLGARYFRLSSSAASTITATLQCKG